MDESRFYFADAAAQGYMEERLAAEGAKDLFEYVIGTIGELNHTVLYLVIHFIQRRNFTFRCEEETEHTS